MCYGKLLRDRDDPIWKDFEAQYEQVAAPKASTVMKVMKKTSQDVQEEKMAKEKKKEEEKKKKEEEKARKAAEKEEEKKKKEEEKAAKEAAKKQVVKAGIVMPQPRLRSPAPTPAPAAAPMVAAPTEAVAVVAEAVAVEEEAEMPALEPLSVAVVEKVVEKAAVKAVAPKKKIMQVKQVVQARPEVDPFDAGEAGEKQWEWKGKTYVRYADNLMYLWDQENDDYGAFQGRYNYEKDVIEECEEPLVE